MHRCRPLPGPLGPECTSVANAFERIVLNTYCNIMSCHIHVHMLQSGWNKPLIFSTTEEWSLVPCHTQPSVRTCQLLIRMAFCIGEGFEIRLLSEGFNSLLTSLIGIALGKDKPGAQGANTMESISICVLTDFYNKPIIYIYIYIYLVNFDVVPMFQLKIVDH